MSLSKKFLALAAPLAALTLSACATGLPTQVSRFQAMPAPQGQSFYVQAADPRNRGGLEFAQYADLVSRYLAAEGYSVAPSAEQASFVVELDYGVDNGRTEVVARPDPFYGSYAFRPHFSRFGYFGRPRHPFYYGWNDPFFYGPYGGGTIDSYTLFTSFVDMNIRRAADGQALFEGIAQARSRTNELPVLVPNLIEAMFTGFPGNSGETVRITVPDRRG